MMPESFVNKIGWFASLMGICMFVSFVDQIRLNLADSIPKRNAGDG